MLSCIESGEERHQECNLTEARGYNECSASEDRGYHDCCDWAPCSWFCDAWVWVSDIVCLTWIWVTTAAYVERDEVTSIVNAVLVMLESFIGWVLSSITFIIVLLQMIPILGTIIRWILNRISYVLGILGSISDAILVFIGIRLEKILRLCTVVQKDENGNDIATDPEFWLPSYQKCLSLSC